MQMNSQRRKKIRWGLGGSWAQGILSPWSHIPFWYMNMFTTLLALWISYLWGFCGGFIMQVWSIMNSVYSPSPLSGEQEMKILSFSSWLDLSGPALLQEPTQSHRNKTKDAPHTLNRLPWWLSGKEPVCQCWSTRFNLWVGKSPWRRKWQPTPVFWPGESHGQGSYSPGQSMGSQKIQTWLSNLGTICSCHSLGFSRILGALCRELYFYYFTHCLPGRAESPSQGCQGHVRRVFSLTNHTGGGTTFHKRQMLLKPHLEKTAEQYQSVRLPGFLLKTIHPGKKLIRWASVCCVASVVSNSLRPYEQ